MTLLLAVLGAVAVAVGVGMLSLPAGVIVAGVEAIVAAYVIRYLEARRHEPGDPGSGDAQDARPRRR